MGTNNDQNNMLLKFLPLLLVIISVAVASGTVIKSVSDLEDADTAIIARHVEDVAAVKSDLSANTKTLQTLTGKIILIENNLEHMRDSQDEQRVDNKEILEILRK